MLTAKQIADYVVSLVSGNVRTGFRVIGTYVYAPLNRLPY